MSVQANKRSITAFVLGALAVGFVMILTFGGSDAFSKHETFILYFNGSVNGLDDTSLVKFRGVPIGYVDTLKLHLNQLPLDRRVPVLVKVDVTRLRRQLNLVADLGDPVVLEQQIQAGLRGKLEVDSYITGKMYVDLGYYPGSPKPPVEAFESGMPEIPTRQSNGSQYIAHVVLWSNKLGQFDYHALEVMINEKLDQATARVAGLTFASDNQSLLAALAPLEGLDASTWNQRFASLLEEENSYRASADRWQGTIVQQSASVIQMGTDARAGLGRLEAQMQALRDGLQPEGETRQSWEQMLQQTTDMAKSLRQKATDLEEPPVRGAK